MSNVASSERVRFIRPAPPKQVSRASRCATILEIVAIVALMIVAACIYYKAGANRAFYATFSVGGALLLRRVFFAAFKALKNAHLMPSQAQDHEEYKTLFTKSRGKKEGKLENDAISQFDVEAGLETLEKKWVLVEGSSQGFESPDGADPNFPTLKFDSDRQMRQELTAKRRNVIGSVLTQETVRGVDLLYEEVEKAVQERYGRVNADIAIREEGYNLYRDRVELVLRYHITVGEEVLVLTTRSTIDLKSQKFSIAFLPGERRAVCALFLDVVPSGASSEAHYGELFATSKGQVTGGIDPQEGALSLEEDVVLLRGVCGKLGALDPLRFLECYKGAEHYAFREQFRRERASVLKASIPHHLEGVLKASDELVKKAVAMRYGHEKAEIKHRRRGFDIYEKQFVRIDYFTITMGSQTHTLSTKLTVNEIDCYTLEFLPGEKIAFPLQVEGYLDYFSRAQFKEIGQTKVTPAEQPEDLSDAIVLLNGSSASLGALDPRKHLFTIPYAQQEPFMQRRNERLMQKTTPELRASVDTSEELVLKLVEERFGGQGVTIYPVRRGFNLFSGSVASDGLERVDEFSVCIGGEILRLCTCLELFNDGQYRIAFFPNEQRPIEQLFLNRAPYEAVSEEHYIDLFGTSEQEGIYPLPPHAPSYSFEEDLFLFSGEAQGVMGANPDPLFAIGRGAYKEKIKRERRARLLEKLPREMEAKINSSELLLREAVYNRYGAMKRQSGGFNFFPTGDLERIDLFTKQVGTKTLNLKTVLTFNAAKNECLLRFIPDDTRLLLQKKNIEREQAEEAFEELFDAEAAKKPLVLDFPLREQAEEQPHFGEGMLDVAVPANSQQRAAPDGKPPLEEEIVSFSGMFRDLGVEDPQAQPFTQALRQLRRAKIDRVVTREMLAAIDGSENRVLDAVAARHGFDELGAEITSVRHGYSIGKDYFERYDLFAIAVGNRVFSLATRLKVDMKDRSKCVLEFMPHETRSIVDLMRPSLSQLEPHFHAPSQE